MPDPYQGRPIPSLTQGTNRNNRILEAIEQHRRARQASEAEFRARLKEFQRVGPDPSERSRALDEIEAAIRVRREREKAAKQEVVRALDKGPSPSTSTLSPP